LYFSPSRRNYATIKVLYYEPGGQKLIARFFSRQKGHSKKVLERCLLSLRKAGIREETIHIINQKQSSAANRNSGFCRTRKPLVCFLDDDIEITSGDTFTRLLEAMTSTGADIIGPRLVTPAGKIFCADPFFNEGLRPVPRGIGEDDDGRYQYTSEVPWLPSTLFIVKREVLTAVNGFDEGYAGSQMEDVDFCLKARQRDFKCVYAGNVEVIHYNNQRNDRFAENFERFLRRWKQHEYLFNPVKTVVV
jgi:GT2 family glycosyltransferase